jgi:methyl-accepting chemotaxis protein
MPDTTKLGWNRLATQQMMAFAVISVAITVAVSAFSYFRCRSVLEDAVRRHGRTLLTSMEADSEERFASADPAFFKTYVQDLAWKDPEVIFVAVVGADNRIIAHNDEKEVGGSWDEPQVAPWGSMKIKERIVRRANRPVFELTIPVESGEKRLGSLQIGMDYSPVFSGLRSLAKDIALAGLLVFGLSILAARFVSGRITAGLSRLVGSAGEISSGDIRAQVPEEGYEEVRTLARAFNAMGSSLRPILLRIQQLGNSLGEFTGKISSVIQDQAAIASQQAASVSEVTATMEELSRTSHQIAENAESVKNASAKTAEMAQHGTVLMRDGVGAMEQVRQRVGDIAKRNLFLGEKSQEIGKVMEIIKEIASEIHLLALNAAIESAAAGEHGRRFSVVASEVRRLAEKTRESTETIRSIVSEIQAATGSSIQATEQGTREVDRSRETIRLSSAAFEEIIQMIDKTLESSTQISLATHQQTSANEQVVQAMRQVAETIREAAGRIKGVTNETVELRTMAEELRSKASVFKV